MFSNTLATNENNTICANASMNLLVVSMSSFCLSVFTNFLICSIFILQDCLLETGANYTISKTCLFELGVLDREIVNKPFDLLTESTCNSEFRINLRSKDFKLSP